jgi:hypothetical protein
MSATDTPNSTDSAQLARNDFDTGPSGVLQEITFGTKAYNRPPESLSALVMQLIATAQKEVSSDAYGAFSGLVGENSAAMSVLQKFLPEPDEPDDDEVQTTPPPPVEDDEDNEPW